MPIDLSYTDDFVRRHNGPSPKEVEQMLERLGCSTLDELIDQTIPEGIRLGRPLELPEALSERDLLARARALAEKNHILRSFSGMVYHGTITAPIIQRCSLEMPTWYTQYTP